MVQVRIGGNSIKKRGCTEGDKFSFIFQGFVMNYRRVLLSERIYLLYQAFC